MFFLAGLSMAGGMGRAAEAVPELVVTNDLVLEAGAQRPLRLVVRASHVVIDGNGATLVGPGRIGDTNALESAGIGVLIASVKDVTLRNLEVHGFSTGLLVQDAEAVSVTECDFSDNYTNPGHGWGELPPRGGIRCERVRHSVFLGNRAQRVWNGLHLVDSDHNLVASNDFSHCSNTGASLWRASHNQFLGNDFSYGIRIDRAAGEVHARDSAGVLIETGSDNNYWFGNNMTHGGDGLFIRPLNRWVSRGNIFIENDTSYANNNCIESWSPGNVFIRNKANHGSYGFWLGGSDHTVLIGNEAAFNGLTNGNHNAPEPGFGHGGIVLVGGPSSHTIIEGNNVHGNNGAGIAFRGDVASRGRKWRTEHWVVQQNRIVSNQFGIWGRWGGAILLAGNLLTDNSRSNYLTNVSDLVELSGRPEIQVAPVAELAGPDRALVGERVRFDASRSHDPAGRDLRFHWWLEGPAGNSAILERAFDKPGYYRLGMTVDNGGLADLAWRDLIVARPIAHELGTEGSADSWDSELESNSDGQGRVRFADDSSAVVGKFSLRFTPDPYPGAYATIIYPRKRDAGWNLSTNREIRFWIKAENPNLPGFQNAGPVVRLLGKDGEIEFKPARDRNVLNEPAFSEARWLWQPMEIPLGGNPQWERSQKGTVSLERIDAISLSVDSWGGDPFTVWVDGLTVE